MDIFLKWLLATIFLIPAFVVVGHTLWKFKNEVIHFLIFFLGNASVVLFTVALTGSEVQFAEISTVDRVKYFLGFFFLYYATRKMSGLLDKK